MSRGGQVTVRYTGNCTDSTYEFGALAWTTSWTDDEWVMTDDYRYGRDDHRWGEAKLDELSYTTGDVDYVDGADMSSLPRTTIEIGKSKKRTRTVYVR